MGALASFPISLRRKARRRRYALLQFTELTGLFLEAGFDLAYGWPEALRAAGATADAIPELAAVSEESLADRLARLAREYPEPAHRIWFAALAELYLGGAGLRGAVAAMAASLRAEHERDLERHCRELPQRLNVGLLLFYLPAAFLLLLAPLLGALNGALAP